MKGAFASRIAKLEERFRPAAHVRSKAERDAAVAAWGGTLPNVILADPQQRAAIMAGLRADT